MSDLKLKTVLDADTAMLINQHTIEVRKAMRLQRVEWADFHQQTVDALTAQRAEIERLRLPQYQHHDSCGVMNPGDGDCTCGLVALLDELEDYQA